VERVDPVNLQGWVVRGYTHPFVRHLVLGITDARAGRRLLGAISGDDPTLPQVTTAAWQHPRPPHTVNVGLTFDGLSALALPASDLASFPSDFRQGAVARSARVGDTGTSAPEHWRGRLGEPGVAHGILTIHAVDTIVLDDVTAALLDAGRGAIVEVSRFDGATFPGGYVHFGYRDGISQPRMEGLREKHKHAERHDGQPLTPTGSLVLGYPSQYENLVFTIPQPDVLGRDGSYNAFRVLAQDVVGFDALLARAATETGLGRDLVAAKLLGRWPNGSPLIGHPDHPGDATHRHELNDFGYADDPEGVSCPLGSHIRRANPRDGQVVQRGFGQSRRLVRRGIPYGPQYVPGAPDDGIERGLLGNFLCASLSAQFEALMYDWLNLGLQHPDITGLNDPMLGANDERTSRFDIPGHERSYQLCGFGRFVETRGSAYTFIPSITALRYLAESVRP
jgi:deferrochelatase/peroxidase EfeB